MIGQHPSRNIRIFFQKKGGFFCFRLQVRKCTRQLKSSRTNHSPLQNTRNFQSIIFLIQILEIFQMQVFCFILHLGLESAPGSPFIHYQSLACKDIFIDNLVVQVTGEYLMIFQLHLLTRQMNQTLKMGRTLDEDLKKPGTLWLKY